MKAFSINIIGLGNKANHFDFEFGDEFFKHYQTDFVSGSRFKADIVIDKHETFLEVSFSIRGHVALECDRSLETFEEPVKIDKMIVFKYGEDEAELSDEIVVIKHDRATLDLGQYIYEFIVLSLPMKRLHPRFRNETGDDSSEGKLVYTSGSDEDPDDDAPADPRWEQLKKLK